MPPDSIPVEAAPLPTAVKPGADTSEYQVTKWAILIGAALQVVAVLLDVLPQVVPENTTWLPAITSLGGVVLMVGAAFGYQVSRGLVKGSAASSLPASLAALQAAQAPKPEVGSETAKIVVGTKTGL